MIVRTLDGLQALTTPSPSWANSGSGGGSLNLYGSEMSTYAAIYRTQPNIRTVVDFLARNVAQLGLGIYRRVSDTDRQRLAGHELAQWIESPNPATTRYRLIEALMQDLCIYFNAYWLKVRSAPLGLVRLPPDQMAVVGALLPTAFLWTLPNGEVRPFAPSEIVYFSGSSGHGKDGGVMGLSPLETLRRVIAEESAAGKHRETLWRNAARIEGVWEIAKDTPAASWTPTQQQSFRQQWQEFAGGGSKAGMTAVGPVGGTYKEISFSAKDSEYIAARKLTREECAAAYHVPLPMVGILEHATYSNVREMRKMLYADCLGPWLEMIQAEIERQMAPDCEDSLNIYAEFNIAEKLKGSFEEQAASLQMAVGKPWMKVNEARALQNLPADADPASDAIAAQQGGPAAPVDTTAADATPPPAVKPAAIDVTPVLQATRDRQQARLAKLPITDRPGAFTADRDRWDRELTADLSALTGADETPRAVHANAETLRQLEADAVEARVFAIEQHPRVLVQVEPAPVTVHNLPAAVGKKDIAFRRDDSGAVIGAEVVGG